MLDDEERYCETHRGGPKALIYAFRHITPRSLTAGPQVVDEWVPGGSQRPQNGQGWVRERFNEHYKEVWRDKEPN